MIPAHFYEVRPRKDHRGVDLISDALPFGRLWYGEPNASDFVIKKLPPPTPDRYERRLFPPEQLWKFSTVIKSASSPMTIRRSQDFPVTLQR
jgi:hypothetical protein